MRKAIFLMLVLSSLPGMAGANPLLEPWDAPFGVAPFPDIETDDFEPAFTAAIRTRSVAAKRP